MKTKIKIKEERYIAKFTRKEVSFILEALSRMIQEIGYDCESRRFVQEMYDNLNNGWVIK